MATTRPSPPPARPRVTYLPTGRRACAAVPVPEPASRYLSPTNPSTTYHHHHRLHCTTSPLGIVTCSSDQASLTLKSRVTGPQRPSSDTAPWLCPSGSTQRPCMR